MGLATSKRALDAFRRVSQVRGWPTSEGILVAARISVACYCDTANFPRHWLSSNDDINIAVRAGDKSH